MLKKIIPAFVVVLVLVGGGSFYGGMKYADSKRAANFGANRTGGAGANFRTGATGAVTGGRGTGAGGANFRGGAGGGFASGEILSKDASSVTIKLRDGGSQIVFFSTSTQIMKATSGSMDDLVTGQSVVVNGTANSDGSVTARTIQLTSTSTLRF